MTQIQVRQDTAINWSSNSAITPASGEFCYQTDGDKFVKIGDGSIKFNNLPHFINSTELENKLDDVSKPINYNALKSYADKGELLTDAEGLADVIDYAHSTFVGTQASNASPLNNKKFIKVGDPLITKDGIISGFSSSNSIDIVPFSLANKTWELELSVLFTDIKTSYIFSTVNRLAHTFGLLLSFENTGSGYKAKFYLSSNGDTWDIASNWASSGAFSLNTKYYLKLGYDGNGYYLKRSTNNNEFERIIYIETQQTVYEVEEGSTFRIGNWTSYGPSEYAVMDLKDISFVVDNELKFSGCKTGIDVIKSDNFNTYVNIYCYKYNDNTIYADLPSNPTKLYNYDFSYYTGNDWSISEGNVYYQDNETPATYTQSGNHSTNMAGNAVDANVKISNDGYLDMTTNYYANAMITTLCTIQTTDLFAYEFEYIEGDVTYDYPFMANTSTNGEYCGAVRHWNFKMRFDLILETSGYFNLVASDVPCVIGHRYRIRAERTKAKYIFAIKDLTANLQQTLERESTENLKYTVNLAPGRTGHSALLDMNTLKVWINGELVVQPMLRIPYTESKTGSKVVDAIYRDRVNDMREQFGYANYYTLLEENTPHYQVVGSPTISSDYVASGFSSGNYLICTRSLDLTKPFNIEGIFTTSNNISDVQLVFGYDSNFQLFVGGGKFNATYNFTNCSIAIEPNTTYKVFYSYNGSTNSVLKIKKLLDHDYATTSATVTASSITNVTVHIGCWWNGTGQIFTGSVYLKSFKIYVDNKLAYQAVEPPDFTLPQVEVYGLIGQQTLRKSDINGINRTFLYSNRVQILTGSCTSGVEVQLRDAFADDNYMLSVPYSAKSATAFTPTQTGDWFAIGEGIL